MGAFIEQPEVIGGHLEAVWRPFGGCLEAKEAYRGPLAACLGCLTKAASPKLLKLNNHLLINVLNLSCLKPFTASVHCLPARSTGPLPSSFSSYSCNRWEVIFPAPVLDQCQHDWI